MSTLKTINIVHPTGTITNIVNDNSGNVGIGTSTPALSSTTNRTYLTIKGQGSLSNDGIGVLQLATNTAGAIATNIGNIEWHILDNTSSSSTRVGFIAGYASGGTANNIGGWLDFATKSNGVSGGGSVFMSVDSTQRIGISTGGYGNAIATNFRLEIVGTAGSNTGPATTGTTQDTSAVVRIRPGGGFTAALDIGSGGGTGAWIQSTDAANLATNYALLLNPNGGNVGIGNSSPTGLLTLGSAGGTNGNIILKGSTSGAVTVQTAVAAGTWTLTLPTSAGTSGYVLRTDGSGVTSWVAQTGGGGGTTTNALTIGTGLSGTSFNGSAAVTIAVDSTVALRADTHYIGTTSVALNRTSANLALTGISSVALPGSSSGTVTVQPAAAAGTWSLTLPTSGGTSGYVLQTDGSGVTSWVAQSAGASGTTYVGTTAVALNRTSANQALTGITSVTFPGSVSGSSTLQPNSIAYQTYSAYFNVAAAGLLVPHNTALDLTSGNFTIECWVYKSTNAISGEYIFGKSGNASNRYPAYSIQFAASNNLNFSTGNSTGASSNSTYAIGTITLNTWYHVAVVKTGTTIITYLNGVQGTSTTQGTAIVDVGYELVIGNQYNSSRSALSTGAGNGQLIDTYVSNLRILKGTALYTSTPFAVPTSSLGNITNTSLLTLQNATFIDNSSTALTITNPSSSITISSSVVPSLGATILLPSLPGALIGTGDTGTVTSTMIADGTIVNADISASAAIAVSKLASSSVTIGSTSVTLGTAATTVSGLTLTSPVINAATVGGHIIPTTDITYDLGDATHRFRDLYLSGSTLKLGTATLSASGTGLAISSVAIPGTSSGTVTINTAAAAGTWTMTLPTSAGSSGWVLQTDGSGVTSWTPVSSPTIDYGLVTGAVTTTNDYGSVV